MNKNDVLRNRNADLSKQIKNLTLEIAKLESLDSVSKEAAVALINDIEKIKNRLLYTYQEVENVRTEYELLLKELIDFSETVRGKNLLQKWFSKANR